VRAAIPQLPALTADEERFATDLWAVHREATRSAVAMSFAGPSIMKSLSMSPAAFGIVLRGAGFAFRKEVETLHWQRLFGAAFAFSSLIVPFFMGTVIGAIASGRVPANPVHTDLAVWTGPTSLLIGALFVAVCGYLAAVFLTQEASRRGDDRLRRYFAWRAALAGAVSGALSLAALPEIHSANPALFHGLTHRALPLVVASGVLGLVSLALLVRRYFTLVRVTAAAAVLCILWGWAAAQYPYLLVPSLTVPAAAAPSASLVALVVGLGIGAAMFVPAMILLFAIFQRPAVTGK